MTIGKLGTQIGTRNGDDMMNKHDKTWVVSFTFEEPGEEIVVKGSNVMICIADILVILARRFDIGSTTDDLLNWGVIFGTIGELGVEESDNGEYSASHFEFSSPESGFSITAKLVDEKSYSGRRFKDARAIDI